MKWNKDKIPKTISIKNKESLPCFYHYFLYKHYTQIHHIISINKKYEHITMYIMNHIMHNSYYRIHFTMNSLTTISIYINSNCTFFRWFILMEIFNYTMNHNIDYIDTRLLFTYFMNQKILMIKAREFLMYNMNDYLIVYMSLLNNILTFFMSSNMRIFIQKII